MKTTIYNILDRFFRGMSKHPLVTFIAAVYIVSSSITLMTMLYIDNSAIQSRYVALISSAIFAYAGYIVARMRSIGFRNRTDTFFIKRTNPDDTKSSETKPIDYRDSDQTPDEQPEPPRPQDIVSTLRQQSLEMITREIDQTKGRANLSLFLGSVISLAAMIVVLWSFYDLAGILTRWRIGLIAESELVSNELIRQVLQSSQLYDNSKTRSSATGFTSQEIMRDIERLIKNQPMNIDSIYFALLPKMATFAFLELLAFFFLKIYRRSAADLKHLTLECVRVHSSYSAVQIAIELDNQNSISPAITNLSRVTSESFSES